MRTVNSYDKQIHGEFKSISKKSGLKNQCTEMGCRVNLNNPDFEFELSSKDISKHNALNWQDVAGLWVFDKDK